jgi:carboxylesterase
MSKTLVNAHLPGDAFLLEGGPDGVLLVHGLTATTAEMRPLAESLCAAGYTVSGPLLPGHGTDPEDLGRYGWRDWLQTVEAAYGDLKARCRQVAVGGESTGAALTLHLAATHPEIAAVLSYAPALKLSMSGTQALLIPLLAPFNVMITPKPGAPAESDALWKGYDVRPVRGVRELMRLQKAVWPLVPSIRQPILIVHGRLDRTVDPSAPQELYERVGSTDKELIWLERSAHCVALDCERHELFEATQEFLARHLGGREQARRVEKSITEA